MIRRLIGNSRDKLREVIREIVREEVESALMGMLDDFVTRDYLFSVADEYKNRLVDELGRR